MPPFFGNQWVMTMRSFDPDYYERLSVDKDADQEDIKSAYRRKAKEYHPDMQHEGDEDFIKMKEAYDTLSDEETRREYDHYLDLLAGSNSLLEVKAEVRDLYDDIIDYFKQMGGFGGGSGFEIVIDRKYQFKDKIVRLNVPVRRYCRKCYGTGGSLIKTCPVCGGSGQYVYEESLDLMIASGSKDGEEMVVSLRGHKLKFRLRYR